MANNNDNSWSSFDDCRTRDGARLVIKRSCNRHLRERSCGNSNRVRGLLRLSAAELITWSCEAIGHLTDSRSAILRSPPVIFVYINYIYALTYLCLSTCAAGRLQEISVVPSVHAGQSPEEVRETEVRLAAGTEGNWQHQCVGKFSVETIDVRSVFTPKKCSIQIPSDHRVLS